LKTQQKLENKTKAENTKKLENTMSLNCGGIVTQAAAAHTRPWPKYRITHSQIQCRKNLQTFTARWAGGLDF